MKRILSVLTLVLVIAGLGWAGNTATPLQVLFVLKKVFPEAKEINVLVTSSQLAAQQKRIGRAAAQTQLKVKIFEINSPTDIGKAIKEIPEAGFLVVFADDELAKNSNKIYILSKCKEKHIALITSSRDYSDSGALLGVLLDANHKTNIVLNLKHNAFLASKFSDEFIQKAGIAEVLQ